MDDALRQNLLGAISKGNLIQFQYLIRQIPKTELNVYFYAFNSALEKQPRLRAWLLAQDEWKQVATQHQLVTPSRVSCQQCELFNASHTSDTLQQQVHQNGPHILVHFFQHNKDWQEDRQATWLQELEDIGYQGFALSTSLARSKNFQDALDAIALLNTHLLLIVTQAHVNTVDRFRFMISRVGILFKILSQFCRDESLKDHIIVLEQTIIDAFNKAKMIFDESMLRDLCGAFEKIDFTQAQWFSKEVSEQELLAYVKFMNFLHEEYLWPPLKSMRSQEPMISGLLYLQSFDLAHGLFAAYYERAVSSLFLGNSGVVPDNNLSMLTDRFNRLHVVDQKDPFDEGLAKLNYVVGFETFRQQKRVPQLKGGQGESLSPTQRKTLERYMRVFSLS